MTRLIALSLALGLALVALPSSAQAQGPTHLFEFETGEAKAEFLRNLRQKGYIDLAKEFTALMMKSAKPDEIPILKLEEARTTVALARTSPISDRPQMIAEARAAFEPFVKANPNSLGGAQARIEMAKLFALQAVMRVNKAYTEKKDEDREAGAKAARDLYDQADAEYVAAAGVFENLKKDREATLAEFSRAMNLIDKAMAYVNTENSAQNRKRAETVDEARKIFAKHATDTSTPLGMMACAYLVKVYQEGQDPSKIAEYLTLVRELRGVGAIAAQKQANYYDILHIKTMQSYKGDRLKGTAEQVDLWLKAYPFARKTYEGEHLRFEQAICYLQLGGVLTDGYKKEKYDKLTPKEKTLVESYLTLSDTVALDLKKDNGDFAERGQGVHSTIVDLMIELDIKGKSFAKGTGLDDAMVLVERQFQEAMRLKGPERMKKFSEGQLLLRNAIASNAKTATPTKLHDAQFMSGAAFYDLKDLERAAISFEALARANPPTKKSAEAAAHAIAIYKQFVTHNRDESARYYLRDLANYVLGPDRAQLWKGHPVLGIARYHLAMDHSKEKEYKQALEHLAKLPRDFAAYVPAQADAVFIALTAREADTSAEGKKAWTAQAREALDRMGPLPAGVDGGTAMAWFAASVKEPELLYYEAAMLMRDNKEKEAAVKYQQMAKSIANIEAAFKASGDKLPEDRRKPMSFQIEVLNKYNHLGAADVEYRKGNYKRVLDDDMLGGLMRKLIKDHPDKKAPIVVPDVQVVADSLSLVLRSFVQLEQIDPARGAYDMLMRLKPASGEARDNANFTRALIQDLAQQVDEMTKNDEISKLKTLVGKFTTFGDVLSKTLVYDKKSPDIRDVKMLVRFYRSLGQNKKAADLIKTVPEPKFLNQPKDTKFTDDQERELFIYWDFQLEQASLLRHSANVSKQLKDYEEANKACNRIIMHENSRMAIMAKFEQIKIYEDQEKYGAASKLWGELMKDLQRSNIGTNKKVQELYFDAYFYNSLCFYKLSQKPDAIKAGKSELYLKTAANMIVRLETSKDNLGWSLVGPKYEEYLKKEKTLKAAYDTAKRTAKTSALDRNGSVILALIVISATNSDPPDEKKLIATIASRKEEIDALKKTEEYGKASKALADSMRDLQRAGIAQNETFQELYFDAYFDNAFCLYKLSQLPNTVAAGKSELYLRTAANLIVRLESSKDRLGWTLIGDRFNRLLDDNAPLKNACVASKKSK